MEDAGAAPRGGEEGGAVEEVAREHAEAAALAAAGGGERVEVVRLGLVIGVEDGGVDGVAAGEEAANETRADEAARAGDQHRLPLPSSAAAARHCRRRE